MSMDCDYIFVWDMNNPDGIAAHTLGIIGQPGRGILLDERTLFFSCDKHGLILSDIPFIHRPDQILERSLGDPFFVTCEAY